MTSRPCWSWRYRNRFDHRFSSKQCRELWDFCQRTFDTYVDRYEITYRQRRRNPYGIIPDYYYTSVTVHFKHQEDLVLFKLTYEP